LTENWRYAQTDGRCFPHVARRFFRRLFRRARFFIDYGAQWKMVRPLKDPAFFARVFVELGASTVVAEPPELRGGLVSSLNDARFEQAMRMRKQIICMYCRCRRELCPIILGHSQG